MNDAPDADDDSLGVDEDAAATPCSSSPETRTWMATRSTSSSKPTASKGTVTITPGIARADLQARRQRSGDDSFTYTISDGHLTDTATVTVTIGGENDPPNAVNDPSMSVPQGAGATVLDVLANDDDPDGDDLTIIPTTDHLPAHGTVTITGGGTGLTYNPVNSYNGPDTFRYTVSDGHGDTDYATVVVNVVPDTLAPTVNAPAERFLGQTVGSSTTKIHLTWSATDAGSGIASYKLQVSTNGGAFATVSLPHATSTSIDRTITNGKSYRFRVRATDKEGNVSSYQYGPPVTAVRYSQEDAKVVYVGAWSKTSSSKALGGSARNATSNTKSATFVFTGYDVGWIATRTTSSGRAQILIDGVVVSTLDLDVHSTEYRKLIYQTHFSTSGAHTLQVKPMGDGRIDIDGFIILR